MKILFVLSFLLCYVVLLMDNCVVVVMFLKVMCGWICWDFVNVEMVFIERLMMIVEVLILLSLLMVFVIVMRGRVCGSVVD